MVIALIIIAVLVIAAFAVLYWAYRKVFYVPKKGVTETDVPKAIADPKVLDRLKELMQRLKDTPHDRVSVTSFDGLRLSARYYRGREDMPLCICFHGYRGSSIRDFAGIETFLIDDGYNVIGVDERGHWRSQGHALSFGINERFDVLKWIEFARKRFGEDIPIYLFGVSMGGGTVLMASGQELPENVRGIVADCPFNSAKDIILHICRRVGFNPTLSWPLVWASARLYGRFDINATTAAKEVKKAKKPIIIIHGEGDNFVPAYMSKQVQETNPELVEYFTVPEAGHGMSVLYDPEGYREKVTEFIKRTM